MTLLSSEEGGLFLVRRDKRVPTTQQKVDGFLDACELQICRPFEMVPDHWPLVAADGSVEWMPVRDEWRWRVERGRSLLMAALAEKDPEARVASLYASAALSGVELPQLLQRLESVRKDGEDLTDAFLRIRPEPGRTP